MIPLKPSGSVFFSDDYNRLAREVNSLSRLIAGNLFTGRSARDHPPIESAIEALALNAGNAALSIYQPAGFAGQVYSGARAEFRRYLKVQTAAAADVGAFAICAEPIAVGNVGRVYISGSCLVNMQNQAAGKFADVSAGNSYLLGASGGGAQILWEDAFVGAAIHLALIRFPSGGGDSRFDIVDAATTANVALTGFQTIDGIVLNDGKKVLCKNQTIPSENGVYTVHAAAWTKSGQPTVVSVKSGNLSGLTQFMLTAANTYSGMSAFDK